MKSAAAARTAVCAGRIGNKKSSGESFAGNVMKYSVATYLGFAITGLALIVKGLLPAEVLGAPEIGRAHV